MSDRVIRYRESARVCAGTDYGSKRSVRIHNRAADTMRCIVEDAVEEGQSAVAELFVLLDDEVSAPWIAHQLLELASVPEEIERSCLAIIERLAEDSIGDRIWLERYRGEQ